MLTKERTATLSQAILPAPNIAAYAVLALILALLAATFEALFPTSFSLVSPFSWSSVLKDGAKNLGIVLGIGLGLAYVSYVAKGIFSFSSSAAGTFSVTPTEPSTWTEILGDAVASHRLQLPHHPLCTHFHTLR